MNNQWKLKKLFYSSPANRIKTNVLHLLIVVSNLLWKKQIVPSPPYGLRASRVFRGVRGMFLVNPLGEWRPRYILGYFEPHMTRAIETYLNANSVSYDIGANIGYFSLMMAKRVGPNGRVFSFEPNTIDFELLKWN